MSNQLKSTLSIYLRKENMAVWLYFFCSLITYMAIFKEDTTLSGKVNHANYLGFVFSIIICFLKIGKIHLDKTRQLLLLAIFIFSCYISFNVYTPSFPPIIVITYLFVFTFLNNREWVILYKLLRMFFIIQSAVGILCYISFVFGLGIPYEINEYYSEINKAVYVNYRFAYLYSTLDDLTLRLCGLCSEPGYFGKTIAFMLMVDNFNLKNKSNRILLGGMILTWSLAAFVACLLFYIIKNFKISLKNVLILISVLASVFIFLNIKTENQAITTFQKRLEFKDGEFVGDNRTDAYFDDLFEKQTRDSNTLLFGYGKGYGSEDIVATSSIKRVILEHGIVGSILMIGFLFIIAIKLSWGYPLAITYTIVWLVTRYATSETYSVVLFIYLFGGITYLIESSKKI